MADSLTDEQLVDELRSYGEVISLPIKANKRQILMKKLNHLRSRNRPPQQKGKGKQPAQRRQLNLEAFSSDDSENELGPAPGPSRSPIASGRTLEPSAASNKITEVVTRSLRRRPNVSPLSVSVRGRRESNELPARPSSATNLSRGPTSPRDPVPTKASDQNRPGSPGRSGYRSPSLYPNLAGFTHGSTYRDTDRDLSFSDRSIIPFESSDSDIEGSSYEVENKSVNTSFSLNRSRQAPTTTSNHVSPRRQTYDTNHTTSKSSTVSRGRPRRRFYPEHVSFGLVALVLAFFVVVFFGYMFVRKEIFMGWLFTDPSTQVRNYNDLLCGNMRDQHNCCLKRDAHKASAIVKDLFTDLSARKGRVVCGEADEQEQRVMKRTLIKEFQVQQKQSLKEAEQLYNCCVSFIIANPHWKIRALAGDGMTKAKDASEVVYLESSVAAMGLWCRLRRSTSRVLWSLFILVAGVGSLGLVLVMLYWRIQAKEREEQQVFAMVEQIINLLKEQHEFAQSEDTIEQSGLAVQHVRDQLLPPARRDQLLPPARRKAMQSIWDKAVKFIEANESRVRLETQVIEGEEFTVWRWIQAVPNGGKVWQGQAFGEHNEGNAATAIYSPTPCLKIRNMFDKEVESEDGWEENVKDALLEKCQDIKSLVHIYVDARSKEGCVYVKCNSKEAAGRVRQALHGWWFDGRLVTVKHIKVEHYHNRWPEAKFAWRPLQPSTDQMRSLAQPYHRSSLEMT
ncbi:hypothetical protein ACOMHN_049342 [Nucella lapillus]